MDQRTVDETKRAWVAKTDGWDRATMIELRGNDVEGYVGSPKSASVVTDFSENQTHQKQSDPGQ